MMGIPVDEPTLIYGDNQSVLANTTMPGYTLKKKTQSIAFHHVREGAAREEWQTAYVNTHDNVSVMLTKPLPSGERVGNSFVIYCTTFKSSRGGSIPMVGNVIFEGCRLKS